MPRLRLFRAIRRFPLPGFLVVFLMACIADPQPPQASEKARVEDGQAASVRLRVALPESAVGRVDSAVLRWRRPGGGEREVPLAITDSALEAELGDLEPGPIEFEALAFEAGVLAYRGETAWDPSQAGNAGIALSLGKVGRVRLEAGFAGGID